MLRRTCSQCARDLRRREKGGLDPSSDRVLSSGRAERKGRTPLHFMAGVGLAPACVLLIHYGAQVDTRDNDGLTPMHMAAGYANAQTLKEQGKEAKWQHALGGSDASVIGVQETRQSTADTRVGTHFTRIYSAATASGL